MTPAPIPAHRAAPAPAPVAWPRHRVRRRPAHHLGVAMRFPAAYALPPGAPPTGHRPWGVAFRCACAGAGMLALLSDGGWPPADHGRLPRLGLTAALVPLAPALPHPSGIARHVPDLVGAVLSTSALAAGVLADTRGSAWGRLYRRSPGRPAAGTEPGARSYAASRRHRARALDLRHRRRSGLPMAAGAFCPSGAASFAALAMGPPVVETAGLLPVMIAVTPAATPAVRRVGTGGAVYGGGFALGGGCAPRLAHSSCDGWSLLGAVLMGAGFGVLAVGLLAGTTVIAEPGQHASAMLGGVIGAMGATVLIDRPLPEGPASGPASVLVAVLQAAVLLAATAQVRVAGASGHETEPRSQRAAEEGPAMFRRLLAGPRGHVNPVRSGALARFTTCDRKVVNPR
ncbi:hypothetical protein ACFPOI_45130 [Nonomuraea angiospora]|uniref:Integral membrane protein n=1 Tax=Nonomuraea angiospora TaxID=46172 RepID=A0ABR9M0F2_9ACTN|nr:hypothetical protein [Nonomuraea angiospora]MBE1586003.1 hypothetical protein [Nonomuraea angiospora]